jgi:hypothetical protein
VNARGESLIVGLQRRLDAICAYEAAEIVGVILPGVVYLRAEAVYMPPVCLFVVWIDTNCGNGPPDWAENSAPQSLTGALDEAADLRRADPPWICRIEPA